MDGGGGDSAAEFRGGGGSRLAGARRVPEDQVGNDGEYGRASLYVGTSVALALAATVWGIAAANWLLALRQSA